jgi:hypothetical protein
MLLRGKELDHNFDVCATLSAAGELTNPVQKSGKPAGALTT